MILLEDILNRDALAYLNRVPRADSIMLSKSANGDFRVRRLILELYFNSAASCLPLNTIKREGAFLGKIYGPLVERARQQQL